jgi:uncharacterized protein (DUF885 family)
MFFQAKISRFFLAIFLLSQTPVLIGSDSETGRSGQPVAETARSDTALNSALQSIAREFFLWRARTQPVTPDDVNRIPRPADWLPDWSPRAITDYREAADSFLKRLDRIPRSAWSRRDSIDFLLLRSAIKRVHWELSMLRLPFRNPDFYIQQTVSAVFNRLIPDLPWSETRARHLIRIVNSIPVTLNHARINLTEPVGPFADNALETLEGIGNRVQSMGNGLKSHFPAHLANELDRAVSDACEALESFRVWLADARPGMGAGFAIGEKAYAEFLRTIALIPLSPDSLLSIGRSAWHRAVALESMEKIRNAGLAPPPMMTTLEAVREKAAAQEQAIRESLSRLKVITIPPGLPHYTLRSFPAYLEPLMGMGEAYDLTSENELDRNPARCIPDPSPDLPYFYRTMMQDPRPVLIHEGIPGHYLQLALSWQNPDPIRRRYFDSGSVEGIGFYVEELMLRLGLIDDEPRTREILYSFMRLRALRVEVDVRLALGEFSLEEAGDYLVKTVPMDAASARSEAKFFAATPGQAMTYCIGKWQILRFLALARTGLGDRFDFRDFHDFLLKNGNVPIALLEWEYLGSTEPTRILWPADL